MSKKHGHDRRGQTGLRAGTPNYAQPLMEAERLMAARRWAEAKALLVPLADRFPTSEDVLRALAYTYFQLHEPGRYALTCAQAAAVAPNDADLALAAADAYIGMGKLVLAVSGQRAYLDRWPQHPAAAQTRARLEVLEPEVIAMLANYGIAGDEAMATMARASQIASEAGILPRGTGGTVRMWIDEEWRDILLFNFQVDDEPAGVPHGAAVEELIGAAIEAMQATDAARAETLLRQAEALEPDAPDIQNNLAAVLEMLGRTEEAKELTVRLFAAHPDYLFGRVAMANMAIRDQRLQEAQDLLDPLLSRTRFHYQEFALLCTAQLSLYLQQQNYTAIQSWVQMWEALDPKNPKLQQWQRIASMSTIFAGSQRIQARRPCKKKRDRMRAISVSW